MVNATDWEEALRASAFRNIEYSEGTAPHPVTSAKYARKMEELTERGLLRVKSLHLPFYPFTLWQFTALDEAERKASVKLTFDYLNMFKNLSVKNITIHSGGEPVAAELRKPMMEQMKRTCRDLLPLLEEWGASLNVELLPRTCLGNCEEELLEIVHDLPEKYVNLCIDVNHVMARHRELPEIIRKCADRIRTFHISDYDGVDECHWQVGHGVINWADVKSAINALDHDVLLIIEVNYLKLPPNKRCTPTGLIISSAEQDCMQIEYAPELAAMREKLRASAAFR